MNVLGMLSLALLLAPAGPPEPVAIVYSLTGTAALSSPSRPLHRFDRLPAGAAIEIGPSSRLALAFASGARYELGEGARVTLGAADLAAREGPVRTLPRVPPFPRLLPVAEEERPGRTGGAVRIRRQEIDGLIPRDGSAALADDTSLRFQPAAGAARHEVEVQDARGDVLFRAVTDSSSVRVPPGALAPGARYHWTVKALDRPGPAVRGEADFVTLPRDVAAARERWRSEVGTGADLEELLEGVDHSLGLAGDDELDGAVVEDVAPGSPAEASGLRPGDRLLVWSCREARGRIRRPFDLERLEIEESARCAVSLSGVRDGEERGWTLPAYEWGLKLRPVLPAGLEDLYLQGRVSLAAGDLAGLERSWRAAARGVDDPGLAAWFLARLARALAEADRAPESDAAFAEALGLEPEPAAAAEQLRTWSLLLQNQGDWNGAADRLQRALELDRRGGSPSLAEARTLNNLGIAMARRSDFLSGERFLKQALDIRETLAPGTSEVAASLNNLANVARHRGDLAAAEAYLRRAEQIQSRLAPASPDQALILQGLGNLAMERGDLETGEDFYRRALAIFEKAAPGGKGVTNNLENLANVAMERGDLAVAEDLLRRSLAFRNTAAPEDLSASLVQVNLGNIASRRGDLEAASAYYRRALETQEALSPEGWEITYSLTNLGTVLALQGDLAAARALMRRSLAIEKALGLSSVETLDELARLELGEGGDLAAAEEILREVLPAIEKQAPESLGVAKILRDLGEVEARRGRLPEALAHHRRALALERRLAPETTGEAQALHALGTAERRAGRRDEATRDLCRAADVLDLQRTRIGGTQEARAAFEAAFGGCYQACLEGLVDSGRPAEAFAVLERSRARSFLALLAERDLRLPGLSPELDRERRRAFAEHDRIQEQLSGLSAGRDGAEIERLTADLREVRSRQEALAAQLRRESPRAAAIEQPRPLDLGGARAALDPGTVLLEYAVGEERTWLFVVEPSGLAVRSIPTGAKALREEVAAFRRLLERSSSDRAELQARGRRLYDLLVRPAAKQVAGARRLLVSPDGPLHTLPFAALRRGDQYLAEWKPVHSVLSATVYAELARSRRGTGDSRLAVFGDPVYPSAAADPEVREAVERGLSLDPIPASRAEAKSIASLYPGTEVYLGLDATEERAKSLGPEVRLVHFACHGLIDERFPLDSALALTIPESGAEGRDNGLLQAWEIFEEVRLDADLVTLSACDTGLGREMGGEGLVGLVRAFQFAGARSVLAAQWGVADDATADLMKRFYGHLRQGKSKDEALRKAQVELIRGKGFGHPYYWAAFQLTGDWR